MSKSNPIPGRPRSAASPTPSSASSSRSASRRPSPGRNGPPRRAPGRGRPSQDTGRAASFRSRHPVASALVRVALVLAIVATMVVIKVASGSSAPASAGSSHLAASASSAAGDPGSVALPASIAAELNVAPSVLNAVGSPSSVSAPSRVEGGAVGRGADGKPLITYVGAEYCPYCAAERWALAVALARFGTFSDLSGTHSTSDDVYPDTQTLSFYGSHYTSQYLDFQAVEEETNQAVDGTYPTLQSPTTQQSSLLATYDNGGSIPFIDIANRYVITGASYSPQVLQGLSRAQIAAQLDNPTSAVAQAIDGTANEITAAITTVTGSQPSSVADSPAIASIAKDLGA